MKKIYILSISVILAALITYSCSDDFLNAPAQASLDQGTLANEAGVQAALISAYSMLDGWNHDWGQFSPPWPTAGSNWIWGSVASDDAYKGSEPGDQGEISQIEMFQWTPGNTYFDGKFKALYEGISRANSAMKLSAAATSIPAGNKTIIEGEIQFLRAHYHFDAWKMWKNVPYYTEADKDFRKANTDDISTKIIDDLKAAVSKLPENQSQVGRATKGAAQAYLGKVLLYKGDFAGAKAQFDAVVNSKKYDLAPCFREVFAVSTENGKEMIFSIQSSVNDGTSEGQNGNFADRLNNPHGGSPFGCCGFHQPSQNLVNLHKTDANGLPVENFNSSDVTISDNVDPRLDWTVGRDGIPYLTWGNHAPEWIRSRSWAGPYSPKKFAPEAGNISSVGWVNTQLNSVNRPIIRYADVLLMLAECEVEVGSLERARELVNMIRARAGKCAQAADGGTTSNINDPKITWAKYKVGTYNSPWTNKETARNAVRTERRIELALEGHRFFDLRRWGIAQKVMNDYLSVESTKRLYLKDATPFADKHNLYPLPSVQIELSKKEGVAQLKQNPGY